MTVVSGQHQGFSTVVKHFETEALAKNASNELSTLLKQLVESGKIVVADDKGRPRVVCGVGELLLRLGITQVGTALSSGEVHGAVVLAPPSGIILS